MEKNTDAVRKPEALIFDMDGTLFRTEKLLLPAYERMFRRLRDEGLYEGETPPEQAILGALGMLLNDIWKRVLPEHDEAVHRRADVLLLEEQMLGLQEGIGELYPGVKETLEKLRGHGYRLFVASNGLEAYVKGVAEAKGIASLFEGLYSAGEYKTATKVDLVRLLLRHNGVSSAWMVGDRSSDVEAGAGNGLTVIGCDYAEFGVSASELDGADIRIRTFPELLALLKIEEEGA
ncbi:HAD family hydrolase [Paenibacillus alkalitolerans]|uniref:HAD family hydrolase n=1 Tax=Paenibacillus alkalitolerans TaxID=2799335 RepID=UPI0018F66FE2|nr:HAD family hydrolase [Paenibacillus alkalitolerans]